MAPSHFPLRWESTGDQWWYASPIDFAAANGQYDLVRELLHIDPNLLIKLTSLRRLRRLETVWDNDEHFNDVAKCRSLVAKKLLLHCEVPRRLNTNTLIRAGYGGWLLYTAASAGDVGFARELLGRDPLLVFGEGEYGVTDILYAAARSRISEVFRVLLDHAASPRCGGLVDGGPRGEPKAEFRWEVTNRAAHAAARGGNLEILKEVVGDCGDVLLYRDAQGSTLLHAASGRGQVEVVKDLISTFDIATSTDYQGNTALHIAAYRGHLPVVEVLICSHPSLVSMRNSFGDTFLHLAVSGFRAPGFRRVDKQIELLKQLVSGRIADVQGIINQSNNDGRTALHLAVNENIQANVVELLMSVPFIDLNIRDRDGMTPLDLLKQRPRSASSEILIKQLVSAGGTFNGSHNMDRRAIASHLRGHGGIGMSPGTSFQVPDSEIFLYTGIGNASDASCELASIGYSPCSSEISELEAATTTGNDNPGSVNSAARRLKSLLQWPKRKDRKATKTELEEQDDASLDSFNMSRNLRDYPTPLRQRHSNMVRSPSNQSLPSPLTRKKFTIGLMQGVLHANHYSGSPSSQFSRSSVSSPAISVDCNEKGVEYKKSLKPKQRSFNKKLMNNYLCFGAQGLVVEDSIKHSDQSLDYNRATSLVA